MAEIRLRIVAQRLVRIPPRNEGEGLARQIEIVGSYGLREICRIPFAIQQPRQATSHETHIEGP